MKKISLLMILLAALTSANLSRAQTIIACPNTYYNDTRHLGLQVFSLVPNGSYRALVRWQLTSGSFVTVDQQAVDLRWIFRLQDSIPGATGEGTVLTFAGNPFPANNGLRDPSQALIVDISIYLPNGSVITMNGGGGAFFTCVLPLVLRNFAAQPAGCTVNLSWQTVSEQNTSHFIIERAGPNHVFSRIAQTAAAGNSNQIRNYAFTDQYPTPGLTYYRLKMYDLDGTFDYSPEVITNGPSCAAIPPALTCANSLNGPSGLCGTASSGIYSVTLPDYSYVTWSLSPAGRATYEVIDYDKIRVTRTGNGDVTITAHVNRCNSVMTKTIGVGTAPVVYTSYTAYRRPVFTWNTVCPAYQITVPAITQNNVPAAITWEQAGGNGPVNWYQSGNNLVFYFLNEGQEAIFRVTATNGCGSSSAMYAFRGAWTGNCSGVMLRSAPVAATSENVPVTKETGLKIFPNPVAGYAAVTLQNGSAGITEVNILSQNGQLVFSKRYDAGTQSVQVPAHQLAAGVYIIKVSDGKKQQTEKLVIQ